MDKVLNSRAGYIWGVVVFCRAGVRNALDPEFRPDCTCDPAEGPLGPNVKAAEVGFFRPERLPGRPILKKLLRE